MLPTWARNKLSNMYRFLLLFSLFLHAFPAYAQDEVKVTGLSLQSMLVNLSEQIPQLMQMVTAIGYVLGMYMIIVAVIKFKHFGESRTMSSREHSIIQPIIYLTVGALLLYFPTSVQVGMSTFWTEPNPYGYSETIGEWQQFLDVCFLIIQFVGTIAFIKGLVILSHMAEGSSQGSFGRGLTHIIGGIFCINIYQFVQVIFATFGIQVQT